MKLLAFLICVSVAISFIQAEEETKDVKKEEIKDSIVKRIFEKILYKTASSNKAARSIVAHRPAYPEEGKGLLSLFLPSSIQFENLTLDIRTYTYDLVNKLFEVVAFGFFMILDQVIFASSGSHH